MRSYTVAVAALAIQAPLKWTDNAISQNPVDGVISARRGVARRVSFPALLVLAIARELHTELALPISLAIELAHQLAAGDAQDALQRGHIGIRIDLPALRHELEQRLADALESAPMPRRGRPPSRT